MEPGPTASKKETITPSSTIPYLKAIQISARSEPISPSYDINEFVHFYNKESHQNFTNFDRPEKGQKIFFFYLFLHGWLERDEILPRVTPNNQKFQEILPKK